MGLKKICFFILTIILLIFIFLVYHKIGNQTKVNFIRFDSNLKKNFLIFVNNNSLSFFDINSEKLLETKVNLLFSTNEKILDFKQVKNCFYFLTMDFSSKKNFLYKYKLLTKEFNKIEIGYAIHKFFVLKNYFIFPQSIIKNRKGEIFTYVFFYDSEKFLKKIEINGLIQIMHTIFNDKLFFFKTINFDKGNIGIIKDDLTIIDLFKEKISLVDYSDMFSDKNHLYFCGKTGIRILDKNLTLVKFIKNKENNNILPALTYYSAQNKNNIYFFEINENNRCSIIGIDKKTLKLNFKENREDYNVKNVEVYKNKMLITYKKEKSLNYLIDILEIKDGDLIEKNKIKIKDDFKFISKYSYCFY